MSSQIYEKYDTALLGILQNEGKIMNFLDIIFGFLYRRTDFYLTMKAKDDHLGFPPGVALKLTVGVFNKYAEMAQKNTERREKLEQKKRQESLEMEISEPLVTRTEEVTTTDSHEIPTSSQSTPITHKEKTPPQTATQPKSSDTASEQKDTVSDAAARGNAGQSREMSVREEPDGMDDPEDKSSQAIFQSNPESYNGAIRENYSWSQSITDLDISIKVPKTISRGKDVLVSIEKKHLKASYKDVTGNWVEIVNGPLCWDILKEDSMWSLVPGDHIHVNLEKVQERWWEAVLEDEPKINVRKIDPSRPMEELDEEAQSKIQELMYNERQKRLGKPQSHEQKTHEMLKKAWDAEGSPFKGQKFDPSKFNISPNNTFQPSK